MADQKISARTAASSLTGAETLGVIQGGADRRTTLADIKNLFLPYKKYLAIVSLSGGIFTIQILQNDFTGITFAFTNPSNGLVTVTASGVAFTALKTASPGGGIYDAGTQYILSGVRFSTTVFNFRIVLHDGTAASTPNFTDTLFEIIVGN